MDLVKKLLANHSQEVACR